MSKCGLMQKCDYNSNKHIIIVKFGYLKLNIHLTETGMPHPYTFAVDTIGWLLSMTTSFLLQKFLESRPLAEKNVLNRQLLILVFVQYMYTSRAYIISFLAISIQPHVLQFMDDYPVLSSFVLGPRQWSALLYTIYCCLSFSRLLLVTFPTIFVNLNSNRWFYLTGLLTLSVSATLTGINAVMCDFGESYKPIEHWAMAPYEIGFGEAYTASNFTNNPNTSSTATETHHDCPAFPLLFLIICLIIIFEVVRAIVFITKHIRSRKKIINSQKRINVSDKPPLRQKHSTNIQPASHGSNSNQLSDQSFQDANTLPLKNHDSDFLRQSKSAVNKEILQFSTEETGVPQIKTISAVVHIDVKPADSTRGNDCSKIKGRAATNTILGNPTSARNQTVEVENFADHEKRGIASLSPHGQTYFKTSKQTYRDSIKNRNDQDENIIHEPVREDTDIDAINVINENIPHSPKNISIVQLQVPEQLGNKNNVKGSLNPQITIWKEILNDLKILFYRPGTYMYFGCLFYTSLTYSAYSLSLINGRRFVYICHRIAAYFSPLVWVAFDKNIRIYVYEFVNKGINSIITFYRRFCY